MEAQEEHVKSTAEPARERIARRLQDAVERLRQDLDQVELWTEVLGGLSRPVPDYNANTGVLKQFELPPQNPGAQHSSAAERMADLGPIRSVENAEIPAPDSTSNKAGSRH